MPCSPALPSSRKRGGNCSSSDSWLRSASAASGPSAPRCWRRPGPAAGGPGSPPCSRAVSTSAILLAGRSPRVVFLVGVLPALLVFWIRKEVPETDEWHWARREAKDAPSGIADLFRGAVRRTAVLTILVCSVSLTAHWAFLFWYLHHLSSNSRPVKCDSSWSS